MHKDDLTAERVREVLDYDPLTGEFTWKVKPNQSVKVGTRAGTLTPNGYIRIKVDGWRFMEHRLVWLYVHGHWPTAEIDHINGERADNRISNLREADRVANQQSQHVVQRHNQMGVRGVSQRDDRFVARITVGRRAINLGTYDTVSAASEAYWRAKVKLHPAVNARLHSVAAARGVEIDQREHA